MAETLEWHARACASARRCSASRVASQGDVTKFCALGLAFGALPMLSLGSPVEGRKWVQMRCFGAFVFRWSVRESGNPWLSRKRSGSWKKRSHFRHGKRASFELQDLIPQGSFFVGFLKASCEIQPRRCRILKLKSGTFSVPKMGTFFALLGQRFCSLGSNFSGGCIGVGKAFFARVERLHFDRRWEPEVTSGTLKMLGSTFSLRRFLQAGVS